MTASPENMAPAAKGSLEGPLQGSSEHSTDSTRPIQSVPVPGPDDNPYANLALSGSGLFPGSTYVSWHETRHMRRFTDGGYFCAKLFHEENGVEIIEGTIQSIEEVRSHAHITLQEVRVYSFRHTTWTQMEKCVVRFRVDDVDPNKSWFHRGAINLHCITLQGFMLATGYPRLSWEEYGKLGDEAIKKRQMAQMAQG